METHPLDSLDEQPGDVPEDVAILHSWANMEGAKYRDFSASRREYRAQMRHRAAEQLRQAEVQAQIEAEAAARHAEEASAIAHARTEEASARLTAQQGLRSGSRSFNGSDRAFLSHDSHEEQERLKAASLRSAVQQARKAAMEREEASKRAKAAAFADSIARREEHEIAEAQASAIRQAAQYAEAGGRPRAGRGTVLAEWIPGEISDPSPAPQFGPSFASPPDEEETFSLADAGQDGPGWMFIPTPAAPMEAQARPSEYQLPDHGHRPGEHPESLPLEDMATKEPAGRRAQRDAIFVPQAIEISSAQTTPVTHDVAAKQSFPAEHSVPKAPAHPPVEVVYRLPPEPAPEPEPEPEPDNIAASRPEPESPAAIPSAVRTLVTEFTPVEAVPQTRGSGVHHVPYVQAETHADRAAVAPLAQAVPQPSPSIAPRPSAAQSRPLPADHPAPAWLYPSQQSGTSPQRPAAPIIPISANPVPAPPDRPLENSKERMAARWFGLRRLFGRRDANSEHEREPVKEKPRQAPIVAVFSIAGGVGKTSLVATLGCALSRQGEKVLLGDAAVHSLLPYYFGSNTQLPGTVRMFCPPPETSGMPLHLVNYATASASDGPVTHTKIAEGLLANSLNTHRMLLDLPMGNQGIFERLREFQPTVLVPLVAEMNSVISIQAIETMFAAMVDAEGHPLKPVYLLNQFDASLPLQLDIREILKQQLGERLLPFVVRRSPAVSEALAEGMTIVDYDPESAVAQDYFRVAHWLRSLSAPTGAALRHQRWSEQ